VCPSNRGKVRKKLINPFSVYRMKTALQNIYDSRIK
jgi:hypothetical protein